MKIKLKDLTYEQYREWEYQNCNKKITNCEKCIFDKVRCDSYLNCCWINHKELYSETFLDQEVEIEVEGGILTEEEKEYLANIIKPFRNEVEYIEKYNYSNNPQYLRIKMIDNTSIFIPLSKIKKYYKNIEVKREYTLEELGL